MKCVVEGSNVKVFGKAIQALSRISNEMWLEPMEKGLVVSSVTSAHSAYGRFLFSPLFFQRYHFSAASAQGKCKLTIKSVLPLFRCLASTDRSMDSCKISTDLLDTRVIFQLFCKHGITKTYNLGFQECDVLQALFPAHLCPNVLKAQASLLGDMVIHFPASQEEVTLSVSPERVILRNYYEERDHKKVMSTEMSLHPKEFDYFHVRMNSDITFCLKELRGLLLFAESHRLPVYVHFGRPGQPVRFSVENMVLEASVVLATLSDPERSAPVQNRGSPESAALSHLQDTQANATLRQVHVEEQVPSSQGSPVLSRTENLGYLCLHVATGTGPSGPHEEEAEPVVPVMPGLHSLLFGAASSQQSKEGTKWHTILACASDTDEDDTMDRSTVRPLSLHRVL